MAMGFMAAMQGRARFAHNCIVLCLCVAWPWATQAADVALVGLLPGKALVVVDGGKRQTVAVGAATAEGVRLVSVESGVAVFEIDGKRRRVRIGETVVSAPRDERMAVTLVADSRGHFFANGSVNGAPIRFLVDTGATLVSLGAGDARRAGIDASRGTPAMSMTANGPTRVWRVRLANVKIGDIALSDVEASVHEHDLPIALLGMSFLNRMEIRRDGVSMVLTQRY